MSANLTQTEDCVLVKNFIGEEHFTVTLNEKNGFIIAKPGRPFDCKVCARRHDHQGLFAFRQGDGITVNCFSNSANHHVATLPKIKLDE